MRKIPRPCAEEIFCPTIGLGIASGSNPVPGSEATISIPRSLSQATVRWMALFGSPAHPCRIALASASRSARSTSNSFPAAHFISLVTSITPCSTGSIELISAVIATSSRMLSLLVSNSRFDNVSSITSPFGAKERCSVRLGYDLHEVGYLLSATRARPLRSATASGHRHPVALGRRCRRNSGRKRCPRNDRICAGFHSAGASPPRCCSSLCRL